MAPDRPVSGEHACGTVEAGQHHTVVGRHARTCLEEGQKGLLDEQPCTRPSGPITSSAASEQVGELGPRSLPDRGEGVDGGAGTAGGRGDRLALLE